MRLKVAYQPRRTRAFWFSHIEQWKSSGLSKADYCREHKLSSGSFYNWVSRQSASTAKPYGKAQKKTLKFLPVNVENRTELSAMVSMQKGGFSFSFPANMPEEHIERWLSRIGQLHA